MPPKRARVEEEVQMNETMQGDDRRIEDQKGAGKNDRNHAQDGRRQRIVEETD